VTIALQDEAEILKNAVKVKTYRDFLEKFPPGVWINPQFWEKQQVIKASLFCTKEQEERMFSLGNDVKLNESFPHKMISLESEFRVLKLKCKNCEEGEKYYFIKIIHLKDLGVRLCKIGEYPSFGPPMPPKVKKLVGQDRKNVLKGYEIEKQGYGIGAFAYYRRVIEDQKDLFFDEIIRVSKGLKASEEIISGLEDAKKNKQFKKGLETIVPAVPEALKINGHNPLVLIHKALSIGVHSYSDENCLELAGQLRTVLFELAERLSIFLKDDRELAEAVKKLSQTPSPTKERP